MSRELWWATLNGRSPRYADWQSVLHEDRIPLRSAQSLNATLEGEPRKQEVYLLDLGRLSEEQLNRLICFCAKKFKATEAEVRDGILHDGFPVRAEDVTIAFDLRCFV